MSHLWAEQLSVLLCPDRVLVAHRARGFRPGPMTTTVVPVAAPSEGMAGWEPAAAALSAYLTASPQWRGAELRIVVSNHFVRYALIPWSDDLSNEKEHLLLARRHFAQTHGPVAKNWAIRMSLDRPGDCHVASAMDEALVNQLTLIAEACQMKLVRVEPLLMAAFNRWQQDFREEAQWFVMVEDGMLCGALVGRDRWMALRRWRTQDDWVTELPLWLSREQLMNDEAASAGAVYLLAPPREAHAAIDLGASVTLLREQAQDGGSRNGAPAQAAEEADYFSCIL